MQKIIFSRALFFSICLSVAALFYADIQAKKPWTFLVYLAGANDLDSFINLNINQMAQVGSNDDIDIIVYLSTHYEGQNKETKKLYVNKGSLTQYGPTESRDSGDVTTLQDALAWAINDFPSEHIAVVLWDHGDTLNRSLNPSYNRGICYDFDTGHYLTDRDLLHAFSWVRDTFKGGAKFDIIAIDACLMGSMEIAMTLSSCADYLVASEETIPGEGYDYARLLRPFETEVLNPLAFAQQMVAAYQEKYVGMNDYTLSAIDLKNVNNLIANLDMVTQMLMKQLQGKQHRKVKKNIRKAMKPSKCPSFDSIYIDLFRFYKNISKKSSSLKFKKADKKDFKKVVRNGLSLVSDVVKANVTSNNHRKACGLSIYCDRYGIDSSYYDLFWTEVNPFWLDFLKGYVA